MRCFLIHVYHSGKDIALADLLFHKGNSLCEKGSNLGFLIHGSPAKYSDEPEGWTVWTDESGSDCDANDRLDEQTREIAWEHVDECAKCSPNSPCFGGRAQTLFGKTIDHVCRTQMIFINPDVEALQCLKKLVAIRQEDILSNDPNSMNMG